MSQVRLGALKRKLLPMRASNSIATAAPWSTPLTSASGSGSGFAAARGESAARLLRSRVRIHPRRKALSCGTPPLHFHGVLRSTSGIRLRGSQPNTSSMRVIV
jgi:hypothetical protein